ncbi:hypothetical protein [Chromobacterium sphagni]|uniref:hypothetical protein n=1 Tax=Chromobacterium sphagni TaxID=1903179 RepID=UPI0013014361|nr:hypothetical protein [Chromobacterium sphagni]
MEKWFDYNRFLAILREPAPTSHAVTLYGLAHAAVPSGSALAIHLKILMKID